MSKIFNKKSFQLIRFNPIGRVSIFQIGGEITACFQLIRFNPIGRAPPQTIEVFESTCFQLIRFNPIGRELAQQPLPSKGFSR